MSDIEKKIDHFIESVLQKNCIDFIRIKNSISQGNTQNVHTHVFGHDETFQSHKYFPDYQFGFNKKVFMVENGIKVGNTQRHKYRKEKQHARMKWWMENAGVLVYHIYSIDDAKKMFNEIGIKYN